MCRVRVILLAGAAAIVSTSALAADMPPVMYPAPPIEAFGGWYLRGDIGMSNQRVKNIHNILMDDAPQFTWVDKGGFDSAPIVGVGVGYQFNNWLRFDGTAEYRGGASFHAMDRFFNPFMGVNGLMNTNEYTAVKSEWVFLANAYFDLGTWWCLTPFVGAGVGASRVTIDHFRDNNIIASGGGVADGASKWNFAWALHAGVAYKVTPGFTVELAYRYLNLGDGITGDVINLDGTNSTIGNATTFHNLTSHDLKLGVRWSLEPAYAPPLMRKG
jgi:opacity protein-like surface antigen